MQSYIILIFSFVGSAISNYVPISYNDITSNIAKLNLTSLNGLSFNAKYLRIIRLLASIFYVNRKASHIGQSKPENSTELCMKIFKRRYLN